jgi:uncharacterized repeat protein (TIGR01451 family)
MRVLVAVIGVLVSARGGAMTTDGTVLTNIACATMSSVLGAPASVLYCATDNELIVENPNIRIMKTCNPTTEASGGTITCTMCVENTNGFMDAYNVKIVDKIPVNMGWVGTRPNALDWGGPWTYWSSTDGSTWVAGDPPAGQVTPYYVRWMRAGGLSLGKSGCVTFTLTIL